MIWVQYTVSTFPVSGKMTQTQKQYTIFATPTAIQTASDTLGVALQCRWLSRRIKNRARFLSWKPFPASSSQTGRSAAIQVTALCLSSYTAWLFFFFFHTVSNFNIMKTLNTLSACWVIVVFHNPPNSDMDYTWSLTCMQDLFACIYTRGTSVYSLI